METNHVQRRGLFAGATALAVMTAAAAPLTQCSPIVAAGLQLKGCWDRHDAAEIRLDSDAQMAAVAERRRHEKFILASTPTTVAECAVVLMLAVSEIDCGQNCQDGFDVIDDAERVCERVTLRLFELAGLDATDFTGQFYLRDYDLAGRA